MKTLMIAILVLSLAACTTGRVKPKAYSTSDRGSGAFVGYEFPTNR